MITDERLNAIFDEVAKQIRSSVTQPRCAIIRESRRRLRVDSDDVAAVHVIAAASLMDRQPERSLSLLRQSTSALRGSATGHRLAGYAHVVQQQLDQAKSHFDQAVRIDPCQYDSWAILGGIEEMSGLHDQAIMYYQRALVFDDKNHESALALSRIYSARRNLKDAIDTLRISLLRDRRNPKLNLALARLLQQRGGVLRRLRRWNAEARVLCEAVDCLQVVVAAAPTSDVCVSLGSLQRQLGHHDDAKRAFSKAVDLNPHSAVAITHLAGCLVDHGEIDQALVEFRRSIEIDPQRAITHFRYTRAQRFTPSDSTGHYAESLAEMVADENRSAREQVHLKFALAKVLDDSGDYDRAWHHYDQANRLKTSRHATAGAQARPLSNVVDDAKRVHTADSFRSRHGVGSPSRLPVFVVGMPRSGTTLTEQILASHPQIAGAGELKHIDRIRQRMIRESDARGRAGGHCAASCPSLTTSAMPSSPGRYPDLLLTLSDGALREHADRYLADLDGFRGDASRVTDKMPTNFLHLGLIALLFPGATIIHCRRNPMDVLISAYCQNLSPPFCDLQAMVAYHRQYRRLMAYWEEVLPLKIHSIDYETLVTDPEPSVRAMIEHCELPWDSACLAFHSNRRSVHTPSKWQVRQPMYSTSIDRWRRFESYLSTIAQQIEKEIDSESLASANRAGKTSAAGRTLASPIRPAMPLASLR